MVLKSRFIDTSPMIPTDDERRAMEDALAGMGEDGLRSVLRILGRRVGCDTVLDALSIVDGGWAPDAGWVRAEVAYAIESAYEDESIEHIDVDEGQSCGDGQSVLESVCDRFSDLVEDLLDAGRPDDAASLLYSVSDALRDPDIPWKGTPEDDMGPRRRLADRIDLCVSEGRPGEALSYEPGSCLV